MLVPLVILAILSVTGGLIGRGAGLGPFGAFLAPVTGAAIEQSGTAQIEETLIGLALLVAALGFFIADRIYRRKPERATELAKTFDGPYTVLTHKYYVDEFYGAAIVKPLIVISNYILDWVVDKAILGGTAWMLGGIAKFCGAVLQRWQSGNIRSYAAWLTAGAAGLLLLVLVPWSALLAQWFGIHIGAGGH